jgi:hypothetical protein
MHYYILYNIIITSTDNQLINLLIAKLEFNFEVNNINI